MFLCHACGPGQKQSGTDETETVEAPAMTIHQAAFMGNLKAIKQHIKAGTDLNQKDEYGSAPLAIAAVFNKPDIAKALVEGGADLNVTSADQSTPMHSAAFFCRKEIVELLLANGADLTLKNAYGSTAYESVAGPFDEVKPAYDEVSQSLGPLGFKLDYQYVEETRPLIAQLLLEAQQKSP
jgi:hypothetical protein